MTRHITRRSTLAATAVATLGLGACAATTTPAAKAEGPGYTIVIPVVAREGRSRDEVLKALQRMMDVYRKSPALIDGVLLENTRPGNRPQFLQVTRWRDQKDWATVFTGEEFGRTLRENDGIYSVDGGGVFAPVK